MILAGLIAMGLGLWKEFFWKAAGYSVLACVFTYVMVQHIWHASRGVNRRPDAAATLDDGPDRIKALRDIFQEADAFFFPHRASETEDAAKLTFEEGLSPGGSYFYIIQDDAKLCIHECGLLTADKAGSVDVCVVPWRISGQMRTSHYYVSLTECPRGADVLQKRHTYSTRTGERDKRYADNPPLYQVRKYVLDWRLTDDHSLALEFFDLRLAQKAMSAIHAYAEWMLRFTVPEGLSVERNRKRAPAGSLDFSDYRRRRISSSASHFEDAHEISGDDPFESDEEDVASEPVQTKPIVEARASVVPKETKRNESRDKQAVKRASTSDLLREIKRIISKHPDLEDIEVAAEPGFVPAEAESFSGWEEFDFYTDQVAYGFYIRPVSATAYKVRWMIGVGRDSERGRKSDSYKNAESLLNVFRDELSAAGWWPHQYACDYPGVFWTREQMDFEVGDVQSLKSCAASIAAPLAKAMAILEG